MNIDRLLIKEKSFKLYNTIHIKNTELKRGRLENHMAKDNEHICMKQDRPQPTPKNQTQHQKKHNQKINKNSIY